MIRGILLLPHDVRPGDPRRPEVFLGQRAPFAAVLNAATTYAPARLVDVRVPLDYLPDGWKPSDDTVINATWDPRTGTPELDWAVDPAGRPACLVRWCVLGLDDAAHAPRIRFAALQPHTAA